MFISMPLWRVDKHWMWFLLQIETISSKLKSSISGVICKLDIENMYSYVN